MARPVSVQLTDRETQIMEILWSQGEATAESVRGALPDGPHDSTVRTLLRVLKDKGYVQTSGRQPTNYRPLVTRQQAQRTAARGLVTRLFGGAADQLVLRLLEDEAITPQQLDDLKKQLAATRRKKGRS
jgi:predicted transcriptional regulator